MLGPNQTDRNTATRRDREPGICLRELMQIITQEIYPGENRLEHLLDRLEGAA